MPLSNSTVTRAPDGVGYGGQRVERADGAVDLPAAVVGHDDAVHAGVGGAPRVRSRQDALDDDRAVPVLLQERQVVPGQRGVAEDLRVPQDGGLRILVDGLGQGRLERRVGQVVLDANASEERQVAVVQVTRPPGQHPGVERDHEYPVAGGLSPAEQAGGDCPVFRPVELVPPLAVAVRGGDFFQRCGRGCAQHHRHVLSGGGAGDGELAVRVRDPEHAERSEQERHRQLGTEHGRSERRRADVRQHARHKAPPAEGIQILPSGVARPGGSGDVAKGTRRHHRAGGVLELARSVGKSGT